MTTVLPRYLFLRFPNWAWDVLGREPDEPSVVVERGRILGVSPLARREGLKVAMAVRHASAYWPDMTVYERHREREVQGFTELMDLCGAFSPFFSFFDVGACYVPLRALLRVLGSETSIIQTLREYLRHAVVTIYDQPLALDRVELSLGVAHGVYIASLAAEQDVLVPVGENTRFVSALSIASLEPSALAQSCADLGLRTLGDFCALAPGDVAGRYGSEGLELLQLLRGERDRTGTQVSLGPEQEIHLVFDEDLQEMDRLLFAMSAPLAVQCETLRAAGSAAFSVEFEVVIDDERSVVQWRFPQGATERVVLDRVRWQLERLVTTVQELQAREGKGELWRGGVIQECFVRFSEVGPPPARQLNLTEKPTSSDDAVVRSLTRLTVALGEENLCVLQPLGGRSPQEGVRMVPWIVATGRSGSPRHRERSLTSSPQPRSPRRPRRSVQGGRDALPWPGSLAGQDPPVVYQPPRAIRVLDVRGGAVVVGGRGSLSDRITSIVFDGEYRSDVVEQWGPWLVEERWWSSQRARRYARLLVICADRSVHLIYCEQRRWFLEATFD